MAELGLEPNSNSKAHSLCLHHSVPEAVHIDLRKQLGNYTSFFPVSELHTQLEV